MDEAEIEVEIASLQNQFESAEAFEAQLEQLGLNQQSLRQEVENQLINNQYYTQIAAENNITVTEEEVAAAYETQVVPQGNVPPLSEISPQIKSQLEQQKLQEVLISIVQELRASADIQILI